jgi:Zn-dependent peptidase ImmA (M78 family)
MSSKNGQLRCGDYNANEVVEKAAEVFAAEFIYPERDFLTCVEAMGLERGNVTPEMAVALKRACGAPVSYVFLRKRLEWFNFIEKGEFLKAKFQNLEQEIYGLQSTGRRGSKRAVGELVDRISVFPQPSVPMTTARTEPAGPVQVPAR